MAMNFRTSIETPLSTQTFSAVEIETYPGGNNDITKVIQSLPGISPSIGGFRNDIIIIVVHAIGFIITNCKFIIMP